MISVSLSVVMLSVEILGVISVVMLSFVMLSGTRPNGIILCHFAQRCNDADSRYVEHYYH